MSAITTLFGGPLAQAIGWALLHLLWQGVLVAAILAAIISLFSLVLLLKVWKPANAPVATPHRHTGGNVFLAWSPYLTLVVFVLLWGRDDVKLWLNKATVIINWPRLLQK